MAIVRRQISVPAADSVDVNLAPFDRFAGRGGRVFVKATVITTGTTNISMTLMIGSDIVAEDMLVPTEKFLNEGPITETPGVGGHGAPADPITVRLSNADAGGAHLAIVEANIENL